MRLLKTPREAHAALRYLLLNARRHAAARTKIAGKVRTLTRNVHLDPASSALWFDGWKRTAVDALMRPTPGRPTAARSLTRSPFRRGYQEAIRARRR